MNEGLKMQSTKVGLALIAATAIVPGIICSPAFADTSSLASPTETMVSTPASYLTTTGLAPSQLGSVTEGPATTTTERALGISAWANRAQASPAATASVRSVWWSCEDKVLPGSDCGVSFIVDRGAGTSTFCITTGPCASRTFYCNGSSCVITYIGYVAWDEDAAGFLETANNPRNPDIF
jgi:hypothetical protein